MLKVAMIQAENRRMKLTDRFIASNKIYCDMFNIEHIFYQNFEHTKLPPWWAKVALVHSVLFSRQDLDVVLWVDSDAYALQKKDIRTLISRFPKAHFLMTPDSETCGQGSPAKFCAGVFIVRNTKLGRQLIEDWLKLYNPNDWTFDINTGKWSTDGEWAGPVYEQGSFIEHIMTDPFYKPLIQILPYYTLNHDMCNYPVADSYFTHMCSDDLKENGTQCPLLITVPQTPTFLVILIPTIITILIYILLYLIVPTRQ